MAEASKDNITIFGATNYRHALRPFGIKRDDRRRHMYIIGKTGMGKTTLLENLIISDIINGEGCCYIDPHGDTAEKILDFIPSHRINDVVYMNPADTSFPIAFNIMEAVEETHKHLIASGIVSVFKKQFAESWGPRLEYILRNTIMALLDYPGSTLLGVMRILVEKDYRDKVVEKIKDPVVRSFWVNEFTKWNDRVLQEVISPIQNKVGQFLSNFLIRNIVGQVKSTMDLREIMDNQKILILNLAKGRIGEDTMQLLGSMIVTKLYMAAMSRVEIPEDERKDFYLYVDEFQNFATDSFSNILSEARKYRLNLVVAHQYIEQLPEEVSAAVFGNVGTLICFRTGAADAEKLVLEFTPFFTEEDLVNLPAFAIYLKLMIDGVSSDPFSADTLPPLFGEYLTNSREKVINVSRERYANSRSDVEDKINRWSGMELADKMGIMSGGPGKGEQYEMGDIVPARESAAGPTISLSSLGQGTLTPKPRFDDRPRREERPRDDRPRDERPRGNDSFRSDRPRQDDNARREPRAEAPRRAPISDGRPAMPRIPGVPQNNQGLFDAKCASCNKDFKLKFKPDPARPTYCDDCFRKVREERRKKTEDRDARMPMAGENIVKEEVLAAKPISLASLLPKNPPADAILDEIEAAKSDI
ncbi:MAG: type IV secretion system DNA-binding domain-containing protein [Candidatus Buchananbacteria bacterium]